MTARDYARLIVLVRTGEWGRAGLHDADAGAARVALLSALTAAGLPPDAADASSLGRARFQIEMAFCRDAAQG